MSPTTAYTTWDGNGQLMRIVMPSELAHRVMQANGPLAHWLRGETPPDAFAMSWLEANTKTTRVVPNHDGSRTIQSVRL